MDKKIPDGVVLTAAYALSKEWNLHYPDAVRMAALVLSVGQQHPEWQPVEDGPIDANNNAEYIEHCADVLERRGLRVTAGALRVIAQEHRTLSQQHAAERADVCKLVALAEQWEHDAAGCRRDGYIDAAVVKEECAQRIRQTLGIGAIAEALTAAQQETIAGKFDREVLNPMRVAGRRTAPPSVPVGVKTLSEFMAEQEALHPGIHDKVQAAADELRASLAQQSAPPAAQATEVDAPGSHAWMAEVCRAAALSLAAHGVWNDQLLKVADWIAQQTASGVMDAGYSYGLQFIDDHPQLG